MFERFLSMSETLNLIQKVANQSYNVMVSGAYGTKKSMIAEKIYECGGRKGPFVSLNCAAVDPALLEGELFGYAGTALQSSLPSGREGVFQTADGGTLFLDEVDALPKEIQVKLSEVLRNKKIFRIGSTQPIKIDVRLITASDADLLKSVREHSFRRDLYYMLNVFQIKVPSICQWGNELESLIHYTLADVCKSYKIEEKILTEEALNKLKAYQWPCNIDELEYVLTKAALICDTNMIGAEYIMMESEHAVEVTADEIAQPKQNLESVPVNSGIKKNGTLKERLEAQEAEILRESLIAHSWNKEDVMKELKVSKTVLYDKIKKFGLSEK